MHVFVDESERSSYLLAAALVVSGDLVRLRGSLRALCRPGQRRVHMGKEGASRRRAILGALADAGAKCRIYACKAHPVRAREHLLAHLVDEIEVAGATLLVLESSPDSGQDDRDRNVVRLALQGRERMVYEHRRAYEEPLLWLPDIVAWAYGAGGDWRRRAEPMIEKVIDFGPLS